MGVYLELKILPEKIDKCMWQEVYMESLELIAAYPFTDVIVETVTGSERLTFISEIERNINCEEERYWSFRGDSKTREVAERFSLYYDIEKYRYKGVRGQGDDIVVEVLEENNYRNVFEAKTQGYGYHEKILAIAMLIESRFPQYAMVSGNINIVQAKEAQKFANRILKKPIGLPVVVEPNRLYERICNTYKGADLIERFKELYREEGLKDKEIYKLFDKRDLKDYVSERIKDCKSVNLGVIDQCINWLNATGDLEELIEMVCIDKEGPKFDVTGFVKAICNTWVMLPPKDFDFMKVFDEKSEVSVFGQFHKMMIDAIYAGRHVNVHIDKEEVIRILGSYFPDRESEIREIIEIKLEEIRDSINKVKGRLDNIIKENEQIEEEEASVENELTEEEVLYCALVNNKYKEILNEIKETNTIEQDKHLILYRISIERGIAFTEKEWEWIDKEEDEEILNLLIAFCGMKLDQEIIISIRNRLVESRELCTFLIEKFKDEGLMKEVGEYFRNA